MAIENLYEQGRGEAVILPKSDAPQLYRDQYLFQLAKKKEEEQQRRAATKGIVGHDAGLPWDIDAPDLLSKYNQEKNALVNDITAKKIGYDEAGIEAEKRLKPLADQMALSDAQGKEYRRVRTIYDTAKKDTFDPKAERMLSIWQNPAQWAMKDPAVAKQFEEAGKDPIKFRSQNQQYLKLPLRYDDEAYNKQQYDPLEEIFTTNVSTYYDPATRKTVAKTVKNLTPNIEGIQSVFNRVEQAALQGDEMATNYLNARAQSVQSNFKPLERGKKPEWSTQYGKKIWDTAVENYKGELADPDKMEQALIKADALLLAKNRQKQKSDERRQWIAQSPELEQTTEVDFTNYGGSAESAAQRLGSRNTPTSFVPAEGGNARGSTTLYGRSADNIKTIITLGPDVYNATTGKKENSPDITEATLSSRDIHYVYKPGTMKNGKDVGGTLVPTAQLQNDYGKYAPEYMASARIKKEKPLLDAEGNPITDASGAPKTDVVEELVYFPWDKIKNSALDQMQGGKWNQKEEQAFENTIPYEMHKAQEKMKVYDPKKKSATPKNNTSPSPKKDWNKYKRK